MDIRIGIVQSMKEIDVDLPDDADRDKVMKEVEAALTSDTVLWLPIARAVGSACRPNGSRMWNWARPAASASWIRRGLTLRD